MNNGGGNGGGRSKLISILFKIRDVVYIQITNISLASRLMCRSRSLTAVTSIRLAGEIRCTLSSDIISYMQLNGYNPTKKSLLIPLFLSAFIDPTQGQWDISLYPGNRATPKPVGISRDFRES